MIIEEAVSDLNEENPPDFVRYSVIHFLLKKNEKEAPKELLEFIVDVLNTEFDLSEVERWIVCTNCKKSNLRGMFPATDTFEIENRLTKCYPRENHYFDDEENFHEEFSQASREDKEGYQEENLVEGGTAPPIAVEDLSTSICLLSFHVQGKDKTEPSFGTAFLCSLGVDMGYEVVLMSAGHNFKPYTLKDGKTVSVSDPEYPLKNFDLVFDLKGATTPIDPHQTCNLADFLQSKNFNLSIIYSNKSGIQDFKSREFTDYVGFFLGIGREQFEKEFPRLHCLPVCNDVEEKSKKILICGHSGVLDEFVPGENHPLRISHGELVSNEIVAQEIDRNKAKAFQGRIKEHEYLEACAKSGKKVFYRINTLPGFSGSPVLVMAKADGQYRVIGIHNATVRKMEKPVNVGHRMTDFLKHLQEKIVYT